MPDDSTIRATGLMSRGAMSLPIFRIHRPMPQLGGKGLAISQKGVFVFEEGPGSLITIACTHAGSGIILAVDTVPDQTGFFDTYSPDPNDPDQDLTRPGLELFHGHPATMGSWMLNAGFHHGLTIVFGGGHDSVPAVASVVWMPFTKRVKAG